MIDKGRNKSRRIIEKKRTARREKMYQAVEKIINLLVSIATVLSVLLTYFTLSEMKEERESAYRPDIQFNSVEYVVQTSADMELFSEVINCPVYTSDQYGMQDIL